FPPRPPLRSRLGRVSRLGKPSPTRRTGEPRQRPLYGVWPALRRAHTRRAGQRLQTMSRPMGAVLFSLALLLLAACSPAQPILVTDQPSPEIVYPAIHPTPTDALCHYVDQVLPDPVCTPGVTDPAVT